MRLLTLLASTLVLTGCATMQRFDQLSKIKYDPTPMADTMQREFDRMPAPKNGKITVAIYNFQDKTGQRKTVPGVASFSTAVTQGADAFLIRALQEVGHGEWFDVVERSNIDDLTKERLIIKQMRDAYEGKDAEKLMPLTFAGIILEGGIVGYDSSLESGGYANNWLGTGKQTQYSKDIVTISLRAVSVNTGKVLASVNVTKIVLSTADSFAVLKMKHDGTAPFELEGGITMNEAPTIAVKTTIEAAVIELIKEGERKSIWDYKTTAQSQIPQSAPLEGTPTIPVGMNKTPKVPADVAVKTGDIKNF